MIERRIVHSGKIWSSGGVTSGLDLSLAFINGISGKAEAGKIQLLLEYFTSTIHFVDLDQVKDLPPINTPEWVLENGMQTLPEYILKDYIS